MSLKLIIFDLDGTVAKIGEAVLPETAKQIKLLEEKGYRIAFCSGKPTFYLCGFVRQLSLHDPILIGENGGEIVFGIDLPPKMNIVQNIPVGIRKKMGEIHAELLEKFGDRIWYQPNLTELTPFFKFNEDVPLIEAVLKKHIVPGSGLSYCSHVDCFDVQCEGITKGAGLKLLSEITGILPSEMLSIGDWRNDYPMFHFTGTSYGINVPEPENVTVNFPDITSALNCLLSFQRK